MDRDTLREIAAAASQLGVRDRLYLAALLITHGTYAEGLVVGFFDLNFLITHRKTSGFRTMELD